MNYLSAALLLLIIAGWGTCADPAACASDIDGDGEVAIEDLLAVIAAWGDCSEE